MPSGMAITLSIGGARLIVAGPKLRGPALLPAHI